MSVFAEDVATQTLNDPAVQTNGDISEQSNNDASERKLDTGHEIDVTFKVLYVGDEFKIGYDYGSSEMTKFVCQYKTNHSDTAYNDHTIAFSDIKAAADRATVKSGYNIVGWSKESSANPKTWPLNISGTTACNKGTTIYLVAKKPVVSVDYTLSFNQNTRDNVTNMPSSQTKSSTTGAVTITIPNVTPQRDGYTFKGWATTQGGTASYQPGESINMSTNVTLYAVWEKDEPQHEHDWEYIDNKDGTHTGNCKDPNCDATTDVNEPHVDRNNDGKCDKCDACLHPHENGYCTKSDCDHTKENGYDCCPKKEDPKPVPEPSNELLSELKVTVECKTANSGHDAATYAVTDFENGTEVTVGTPQQFSDTTYTCTVELLRAAAVSKYITANGEHTDALAAEDAKVSWTLTYSNGEWTLTSGNPVIIEVTCNGTQPEVKPDAPTSLDGEGHFFIQCVNDPNHKVDLGWGAPADGGYSIGTVYGSEANGYFVDVTVNVPYYLNVINGDNTTQFKGIEHKLYDDNAEELTITFKYENGHWKQTDEYPNYPVVKVICAPDLQVEVKCTADAAHHVADTYNVATGEYTETTFEKVEGV